MGIAGIAVNLDGREENHLPRARYRRIILRHCAWNIALTLFNSWSQIVVATWNITPQQRQAADEKRLRAIPIKEIRRTPLWLSCHFTAPKRTCEKPGLVGDDDEELTGNCCLRQKLSMLYNSGSECDAQALARVPVSTCEVSIPLATALG